jgi:hypothetical protein
MSARETLAVIHGLAAKAWMETREKDEETALAEIMDAVEKVLGMLPRPDVIY